jgi:glycosyltransferase involved in cell wall biosynthesis
VNILYAGTLPPHPGGTAILGGQLLSGFAELRHSVRALAPITIEALSRGDVFAAAHPDLRVSRYLMPYFNSSPDIPSATGYRELERRQIQEKVETLIAQERPDVMIIGRENFADHVPILAKKHRLPSVLLIQGATTWGMLNGTIPRETAQKLLTQYCQTNALVCVAEHLAKHVEALIPRQVKVIPNPVDLQQFYPRQNNNGLRRKLAIEGNAIVAAHISNLKMLKRPVDIVCSAERVLEENPKIIYVIVGDGPCRSMMEEACKKKRVSERFRFVGWVEYERVPDYINLADIVIMPSEAEAQALVYLETQACGRLLLASDIPGAREVIIDGETGLLFRKGDIGELSSKTLLAASDPALREKIGHKARQQVTSHDLNKTVLTYLETLEKVIAQQQRVS